MFTRLLVGLDGTPPSEVALAQAILLGQRFRSTLVLAHVSLPADDDPLFQRLGMPWLERSMPGAGCAPEPAPDAAAIVNEAAAAVARAGLPVELAHRRGSPPEELRQIAEDVDLVCLGRRAPNAGADPLSPLTRELLQRSPKPVLLAGTQPSPMQHCAVTYDGELAGDQALAFAARYAAIADALLEVIHASSDEPAGRAVLARASGALSVSPLHFETHLLDSAADRSALVAEIRRLECDSVFVGAARTDSRWLVSSATEAILRATDLPVLIHHQPQGALGRVSAAYRRPAPR